MAGKGGSGSFGETDNSGDQIAKYTKNATNAVVFHIVYDESDLSTTESKSHSFRPEMSHQVFGETEVIFGYRELSINLYYLHNSARCFIDIISSGKIIENEMYVADDVQEALTPWLPKNYRTKKNDFIKDLKNESKDNVFGKNIQTFSGDDNKKYLVNICDTADKKFCEFHQRFETFIVWFIDGANSIDLDDQRWMIYYVYEETVNEKNETLRTPIAFCSIYKFFLYPNSIRARISQFFVVPTHHRKGIATKFYSAVFQHLQTIPEVEDITVEEPTPIFQNIRDFSDSKRIYDYLQMNKLNFKIQHSKQLNRLFRAHKLCKRQAERITDILECCLNPGKENENIKQRIISGYERVHKISKRIANPEQLGINVEPMDKRAAIDETFGKYMESLKWSVNRLRKYQKGN